MTLNLRLVLITLVILLVTSVASAYLYFTFTKGLLNKYQSNALHNSTSDFVFEFQKLLEEPADNFTSLKKQLNSNFAAINIDSTHIDFIFTLVNDSLINMSEYKINPKSYLNIRSRSFKQLFVDNPNVILMYSQLSSGKIVYYGIVINSIFLDKLAKAIHAEVSLLINSTPVEISNSSENQKYLLNLISASKNLKFRNNYDLFLEENANYDFLASMYTPKQIVTPGGKMDFIVFYSYKEGADFRNILKTVIILIGFVGGALTILLVLFFTTKLRKQISYLREAAELTKSGNLEHKVKIVSKDELGNLGETFNGMLSELKSKIQKEKEFTELITLINRNPTLTEVSDAVLSKILSTTKLNFGAMYIVKNRNLRLISSHGISKDIDRLTHESKFYSDAIENHEISEFKFHDNLPEINIGMTSVKIKYLLFYPIIYNKETIALLELASEFDPQFEIKSYLGNIHEQLAIGLINARSLEQLENIVQELQSLNDEYEKQNKQILEQNEKLRELHSQLREKAEELDHQREKAVELTKVKSQFLASMSHELRTPLISILGLTELMLKESGMKMRFRDRINIVHRNGKKLLGLITNILEFSKFDSGKIEIRKDSFLLSDLIEDIKQNTLQLTEEKKLIFTVSSPVNKDLLLNTDKSKLEQVLNNLLINSVKFTDAGEISLSIELKENNGVLFTIRDTGIGISQENQKIIFTEFQQVGEINTSNLGGVGLGLAICKKYLELLDSSLHLESEIGKGSKFSFELYNILLDIIDTQSEEVFDSIIEKDVEELQNKILIVSRYVNTIRLINDYLKSYGYKCFAVDSTNEAKTILQNENISAIVVSPDILNGNIWEFIVDVKSNKAKSKIPIVIANILEKEKVGWVPNIYNFIAKPILRNDIVKSISDIELEIKSKVDKIFYVSKNQKEYSELQNDVANDVQIVFNDEPNTLIKKISKDKLQLVFFDASSFLENVLQFCFEVEKKRLSKNIYIVFCLESTKIHSQTEKLNNALNKYTIESKYHPLDVLKVLKERLSIDDSELITRNIIEDEQEYKSIVKDLHIIDNDSKPTVLIVDDDKDSLFTIGEYIKGFDCNTIFAGNGIECLLALEQMIPDLILLDIMMPKMDGFETIKRIRNNSKYVDIPVIALTAYSMLDNKSVIVKNGFDDLVTKPIDSIILASKINHYIKKTVKS